MITRSRAAARLRQFVLAAGLLLAPTVFAQDGKVYTFHWSVTTNENELKWRSKIDWAQRVEFDAAPIRKDIYIFYAQYLGNYPRFGLHQIYMHPGALEQHFRQVRLDVEAHIPADYDGLVCIDYENWGVIWERVVNFPSTLGPDAEDGDHRDDWIDYLQSTHPEWPTLSQTQREALCKSTYDAAAKEFTLGTIELCKSLRPRAKWGFFDYPNTMYGGGEIPWGTIGYAPDGRGVASQRNDEIQWIFDASDVLFPAPYCMAYTIPDGEKPDWQKATNSIADNRQYVTSNIREAVRVAKGKPVIAYMWPRYMTPGRPHDREWINDINLRHCFELPLQVGADGVAIWDSIDYAHEFQPYQDYTRQRITPTIVDMITSHGLQQPPPGGGPGGGGGGGGGTAGGWLPQPPSVGNGVVSQNAFVPGKSPTGVGGWVPPKPGSNNNNNNNQSGSAPPLSTVKQQQPYRVVGSAATSKSQVGSSSASKQSAPQPPLAKADRKATLEAIRRVTAKKVSKVKALADVPDKD